MDSITEAPPLKQTKIRLYIEYPFQTNTVIDLSKEQSHYLNNVMRIKRTDSIFVFNGKDGEWIAGIEETSKKRVTIKLIKHVRTQTKEPDIWLCFAPVKNSPLQNIIQKSTELGVNRFIPVQTDRTVINRINPFRLKANCIEASEQCRRLTIPSINPMIDLNLLLEHWSPSRTLLICDESGQGDHIMDVMPSLPKNSPCAIIIGPEGGFSKTEFEKITRYPYTKSVCLGPRILRADTAAIAALTCCMSTIGDWKSKPDF